MGDRSGASSIAQQDRGSPDLDEDEDEDDKEAESEEDDESGKKDRLALSLPRWRAAKIREVSEPRSSN
jgi:hypothetical protein